MKKIKEELTKCIEDTIHYDPKNAVESVVQQVFEIILKYERRSFLDKAEDNKGNGYYERLARSVNQYFKLKVPEIGSVNLSLFF